MPGACGQRLLFSGAAQRVLAYLAVHDAAGRAELAGVLWPDLPQSRAQSDLRTALWRLRRVSRDFAETSGDVLYLHEHVAVDLRDVATWAAAAISPSVAARPAARARSPLGWSTWFGRVRFR